MAITFNPFYSKYGFNSPGFSVDTEGNITVKSITSEVPIVEDNAGGVEEIFTVSDSGGSFEINGTASNPTLTLTKQKTYQFNISLAGAFTWSIRTSQGNDYETGITFVDDNGVTITGPLAHNNASGTMTWVIPSNAPSGIYYSNQDGSVTGTIDLVEPTITGEGSFTSLLVTGTSEFRDQVDINALLSVTGKIATTNTTQSTTATSGALTVSGGVGIAKNLNVGGDFKVVGDISVNDVFAGSIQSNLIGAPDDGSSSSNLVVSATGYITLRLGDMTETTFTPTGATYNPSTGIMELTIGTHSLTTDHVIKLATGSLVFTCAKDSHSTTHAYPRASGVPNSIGGGADGVYQKNISIISTTSTTITVDVGVSSDTSEHIFVSAATDAVTATRREVKFTSAGLQADIINSTIDNTTIGVANPSKGNFTHVTITNNVTPTSNQATRRDYVDRTASALAVAFGL